MMFNHFSWNFIINILFVWSVFSNFCLFFYVLFIDLKDICIFVCVHMYIYLSIYLYLYIIMFVCICVCIHFNNTLLYIYRYIYIHKTLSSHFFLFVYLPYYFLICTSNIVSSGFDSGSLQIKHSVNFVFIEEVNIYIIPNVPSPVPQALYVF